MSQEEFDNRLRSSFQDEYLPPRDQMWANISKKLDAKANSPFKTWILPLLIAVICVGIWIGIDKSGVKHNSVVVASTTEEETSIRETPEAGMPLEQRSEQKGQTTGQNPGAASENNTTVNNSGISGTKNIPLVNPSKPAKISNPKRPTGYKREPVHFRKLLLAKTNTQNTKQDDLIANPELLNWLKYSGFTAFSHTKEFEILNPVLLKENEENPEHTKSNNQSDFLVEDFDSKHWFNIGMGPQLAINSMRINSDSQAYVHRQLWDNNKRMTSNGTGFQAFAHYGYKFGKKLQFMFETGLNYSLRTEDIKLNETSNDIPVRNQNDRSIINYVQIQLKVIQGTDTTYYLAVSNYSLAVNNKYHIFTLPFRINYEHKLSDATFISAGLGGGLSMISSKKSEHLNMVTGYTVIQNKTTLLSGSANATIGLYTNFNNMGQIGIYTGYQMYMSPFKVNSNQYAIGMSDAQFGIMFRKPF